MDDARRAASTEAGRDEPGETGRRGDEGVRETVGVRGGESGGLWDAPGVLDIVFSGPSCNDVCRQDMGSISKTRNERWTRRAVQHRWWKLNKTRLLTVAASAATP